MVELDASDPTRDYARTAELGSLRRMEKLRLPSP